MDIIKLRDRQDIFSDVKLRRVYSQFVEFLRELEKKKLSQSVVDSINNHVQEINSSSLTGNELMNIVRQKQIKILKQLQKELKIVPKNYYRNLWLTLGMSAFGLPIGVAFGLSTGNMGMLAIGLPIGMGVGIAVGSFMDKKAKDEGKQLNIEMRY